MSVYLNRFHAELIEGGTPAFLLFAIPTVGLLLLSELSWAGPRAEARAARTEQPYRLPAYGGWAWALAPRLAGRTVKARAIHHIEHGPTAQQAIGQAVKRTATEVLRDRLGAMDPADAIRIARDAHPDADPAELASMLVTYGVTVSPVQVALVLHGRPPEITVDRDDTDDAPRDAPRDAPDDAGDAPQVNGPPALTKAQAILQAAAVLGGDFKAADVVDRVKRINRITVKPDYVRTVLSREKKDRSPAAAQWRAASCDCPPAALPARRHRLRRPPRRPRRAPGPQDPRDRRPRTHHRRPRAGHPPLRTTVNLAPAGVSLGGAVIGSIILILVLQRWWLKGSKGKSKGDDGGGGRSRRPSSHSPSAPSTAC
ncbi:hypothetical protein [Streptomyces microflavus]|uniref:hypothetical protein n=1 Tax=Streptomyces microflavus TaxID=1919 RepID=UPI003B217468